MTAARNPEIIALPVRLDRAWVQEHANLLTRASTAAMVFDFSAVEALDSAGISFVHLAGRRARAAGSTLTLDNIRRDLLAVLESSKTAPMPAGAPAPGDGLLASIGSQTYGAWDQFRHALSMLVEIFYWGTIGRLRKRDIRAGALGDQMYLLGFQALGIVALLSFLVGVVLALQSALFLRQYNAGIFLAQMIGWSMLREFGPLMTAIILAGRNGSATTAEIATMGVNEEIDALRTMGINPIQFVAVPKFWAMSITMPLLSVIASAVGIAGAYIVSLLYLDISTGLFWQQLTANIPLKDFLAGISKSLVFSWIIVWIGSYYGFRTRGGAEAVGRETTASVVAAIFSIILADAIFSFVMK